MLKRMGADLGLVLNAATLDRYGITEQTPIVVTLVEDGILLRPVRFAPDEQFDTITDRIMATHAETLRRLAATPCTDDPTRPVPPVVESQRQH